MTEERYGPMHGQIEMLIALCDQLTEQDMATIAEAEQVRGPDEGKYAWRAASAAGREIQVGNARYDLGSAVSVNGFGFNSNIVTFCKYAASAVGVAVSTRDLIGTEFYGQSDYDRLMYPWRQVFPEVA